MRSTAILILILSTSWYHLTNALVSLETIRNLTALTDEGRERIVNAGMGVVRLGGSEGVGQVVIGGGGDGEEVEDTAATALRLLCSQLLTALEKPLDSSGSSIPDTKEQQCDRTTSEFHAFLAATVKFLYEIQEGQMRWQWDSQSPVFDGVSWMQGLWASRKTNSQQRSFIEQQMMLYSSTGCFGKSKEVLRRDVEIVEYLNDLIDLFR